MCGIAGFVSAQDIDQSGLILQAQLDAIRHRGPDATGVWHSQHAALGMQRLAIIDLEGGDQPFWSRDQRFILVFNGEIYNYRTLRQELLGLGQTFDTHCDTEVLMRGIEQWGLHACLHRLNGMFAFALWDQSAETLTLVRDRLGIKPLYYAQQGHTLVFGSEIKALLPHPALKRSLNLHALTTFLTWGHSTAPQTMFEGIYKLPPAHSLTYTKATNTVAVQRYWQVPLEPALEYSDAAAAAECYERLREAVRTQMVSDVPLGAFLSGGLDSSLIVGLMTLLGAAPVQTFSVGFDAPGAYNELADALLVAQHFGCNHYELRLTADDLPALLEQLVWHYDEPFGDAAAIPVLAVSHFAAQHVKVVMTGEGSDEQWGGYRRYQAERWATLLRQAPGRSLAQKLIQRLPRSRRLKQIMYALNEPHPARRYGAWLTVTKHARLAQLLQPDVYAAIADNDPLSLYEQVYPTQSIDLINRLGATDLQTWLPDTYLEKADKATMAASIEGRVPFLDHSLVEWAMRLPEKFKLRHGTTKWLLRYTFADMLPQRTLKKPKHGFAVPTDPWFRGPLQAWTRSILLDSQTMQRGIFQPAAVQQLLDDHVQGREVNDNILWLLLNFELWQRRFFDTYETCTSGNY